MTPRITAAALAASMLFAAPATAQNVVSEWSEHASGAAYTMTGGPGTAGQRVFTMAHVAMFDAVNAIEPRYTPYAAALGAERHWSKEAAASAAAHTVLTRIVTHPEKLKEYEALHAKVLAAIPDGEPKSRGLELGRQAGEAMIALRRDDGSDAANDYRPVTSPGVYVPTQFPAAINWGRTKPFGLKSANQFRPPPPYALTSATWARDYNEVRQLGAKVGSARTEEQTRIAKFWEFVGPGTYNPLAIHLVRAKQLDIVDSARLLALVAISGFDASLAVFEAKYTYNFWRPVTAIRNGDIDGNDATPRDERWEPFIPTPMHPEYPCAHCTFQSAAAAAMRSVVGDQIPEGKLVSTTAPGVVRAFTRLSDYVAEVINARIYDGVHYRTSGEVGAELGRQIGEHAAANYFRPLR